MAQVGSEKAGPCDSCWTGAALSDLLPLVVVFSTASQLTDGWKTIKIRRLGRRWDKRFTPFLFQFKTFSSSSSQRPPPYCFAKVNKTRPGGPCQTLVRPIYLARFSEIQYVSAGQTTMLAGPPVEINTPAYSTGLVGLKAAVLFPSLFFKENRVKTRPRATIWHQS